MICPLCEQGGIRTVIIKKTRTQLFICEECDTVWKSSDIKNETPLSFYDYMTSIGLPPLWSELTDMGYL